MTVVWSTMTCPPSPLAWSNHRLLAVDLRSVPLSCVPPQYWPGTLGTVAIEVNCVMPRPVEWIRAPVVGFTWPLRSSQSTDESGPPVRRPPWLWDCQTPPSLPMTMCLVSVGWNAKAW